MEPTTNIACPQCHGHGRLKDQRGHVIDCPTCGGSGVAVWWGDRWWAWLHPVSLFSIAERHWEHVTRIYINGLLLFFLVGGFVLGGPFLLNAAIEKNLLVTFLDRSWVMAAWWFGLLAGLYFFYRLERAATLYPKIPPLGRQQPDDIAWTAQASWGDLGSVFPEASQRIIEQAFRLAQSRHREAVTPGHVLELLSTQPVIASMIVRMGLDPVELRRRLSLLDEHQPAGIAAPAMSFSLRQLLAEAFLRAAKNHQDRVTPPYLMAAIANLEDPAREVLFELNVDESKLNHVVAWLLIQEELRTKVRRFQTQAMLKPKGAIDRGYTAAATPALNTFSLDLTLRARNGQLPYVLGREDVLQKILRVMESGRRSVLLVGESGVGKTTILQALAERMVTEDVPPSLQDKRLVLLSAASLVAGAGGMGELEGRVTTIVQELARAGNIILAIEDFDQLVGVSSSGGGLDAARLISQEVQRGTFQVVATSKSSPFRRVLEPSGAAGSFDVVRVDELSTEDAIVAVESRIGGIEATQQVYFTYDALDQAVRLSQRYLHEKTLPGKALDILREAATLARRSRGQRALVLGADVMEIISEESKVKVTAVTADEQAKLLHLEDEIHARIVGQNQAVSAVANALRRARAEIRDTKRPIASFLFLGPTGVGKTELAKTVAKVYFGAEENMIRLDMSEYQDVASLHRLLGAPAGYAGSEQGQLTEAVRQQPFSLVLLDELEKAHPDILNIFLQVMDDGRLTDASGRTIDFTNTIIIATSNAGTQHIQDRLRDGAALETIKQELINTVLVQYYRPEFLNRFDAVVVFQPLSPIQIVKIVGLMINQVASQLQSRGITLKADPAAVAELAQQGFDPLYGARPLRRMVQEKVDDALAQFLLQGKLGRRDVAVLEPGGTIRVEKAKTI